MIVFHMNTIILKRLIRIFLMFHGHLIISYAEEGGGGIPSS